jgi:hypothetical protein
MAQDTTRRIARQSLSVRRRKISNDYIAANAVCYATMLLRFSLPFGDAPFEVNITPFPNLIALFVTPIGEDGGVSQFLQNALQWPVRDHRVLDSQRDHSRRG